MSDIEVSRELCAFDEKIKLAALEVAKATERQSELEYQKARFLLDVTVARIQVSEKQVAPK